MPEKHSFTTSTIRIVAEDKIKSAIAQGEFDNLPGMGGPCALIDEPYHPLWWVMRKMQRENLLPKPITNIQSPVTKTHEVPNSPSR